MKRLSCLLLATLLSACGGTPVQQNYYLLRADTSISTGALSTTAPFVLGGVRIAPYIDQPGLLVETEQGQIQAARFHQWAEPAQEGIRRYLLAELYRTSDGAVQPAGNEPDYTINVIIDQMHGTADGAAILIAYWSIYRGGELIHTHQFVDREPLSADGYPALAEAHKRLLTNLAENITAGLPETGGQ